MFKKFSLTTLLILLIAASPAAAQYEWFKLEPLGAGFSIMMPGKPPEQVRPRDDSVSHLFMVRTAKTVYVALYGDYAPSVRLDVQETLAANRDSFLKSVEADLIESKKMTLQGREGLEFTGESPQAAFKSRVFVFGNRVYQITATVYKGYEDAENVNRFFSSFAFTSEAERAKP